MNANTENLADRQRPVVARHARARCAAAGVAVALACLAAAGGARAQALAEQAAGQGAGAPLTLLQALSAAQTSHPNVVSRQAELAAQKDALDAARWQRWPGFTASSSAAADGTRLLTGRIEVPVWNAGRISAEIDAAQHRMGAAEASTDEAVRAIQDVVVTGFTELARTADRIAAAQENMAEHERLLALISRRVSSEISAEADLVLAQARLAQAKVERAQLDTLAANARSALTQATGREVRDVLVPAGVRMLPVSFDTLALAAVAASPALRRGQADEDAADAGIAALRASRYPQVVARLEQGFGGAGSTADQRKLYLGVEFQTGNGFSAQAQISAAQARKQALIASRDGQRRELLERLRTDWSDAQSLALQIPSLEQLVVATRQMYESFNRQYVVGRKAWLELLNAQREASQAKSQLADARWGLTRAVLRMELATGRQGLVTNSLELPK